MACVLALHQQYPPRTARRVALHRPGRDPVKGGPVADRRPSSPGRSLSDTAYRLLRERILACELGPGERVTERGAAAALDLGLSPVRDALTRLAQDGLVQVIPRKGYRVTPLTLKSVDDLFHTWALLGPEIARLGVARADPEQAAHLVRLADEGSRALVGAPGPQRAARFIDHADALFDLLAVTTGNDKLIEVYRSLSGEMSRVWTVILTADPLVDGAPGLAGWEQVIERRDGDGAAAIARGFIQASHASAMRVLRRWPSVRDSEVVPLRS
jgi:DNA-binding GntR family transcriptional regulator